LLSQIEAAEIDARAKCEAALSLLDGADVDTVSQRLEEEKKKTAQAAEAENGNQ
jgi:hypothetical protein